ncbi:hypothetical protein EYF80_000697 [Liparis tanakae]|uniref:Uncharacterized protein n=1 Tax=Liparis tanakae TaxID=230148 RepID=A0A4Z2JF66_9TELE|nr:hypothetical protein EYF80_000697 [Liparis tanakae]
MKQPNANIKKAEGSSQFPSSHSAQLLWFFTLMTERTKKEPKKGPYQTTTANVSAVFDTEITPAGWTFNIWSVIYVWLVAMVIYIVTGLCRKNGYGYVYCSPAVLPYGFFISWCLNLCFNIGWLLVWDQGFVLENFVLDKHVRYILIIYPVVIWALCGNLLKNYDAKSPNRNGIFIAVLLTLALVLFVIRIVLVVWRHIRQPLYTNINPEAMEPTEIAEKQKKIFR